MADRQRNPLDRATYDLRPRSSRELPARLRAAFPPHATYVTHTRARHESQYSYVYMCLRTCGAFPRRDACSLQDRDARAETQPMHHPERVPADYRENMQRRAITVNERHDRARIARVKRVKKKKRKKKERGKNGDSQRDHARARSLVRNSRSGMRGGTAVVPTLSSRTLEPDGDMSHRAAASH